MAPITWNLIGQVVLIVVIAALGIWACWQSDKDIRNGFKK